MYISYVLFEIVDADGSSNSLAEKKRTGPPENTTTYIVSVIIDFLNSLPIMELYVAIICNISATLLT